MTEQVACLETLAGYVESFGAHFRESTLAVLLPTVFLKAEGCKTRAAVEEILRHMQSQCDTEALLTALQKTFSHANLNIQVRVAGLRRRSYVSGWTAAYGLFPYTRNLETMHD